MEIKCINLGYVVSDEKADFVETIFTKHASWMNEFYSEANDGPKYLIYLHISPNLLSSLTLQIQRKEQLETLFLLSTKDSHLSRAFNGMLKMHRRMIIFPNFMKSWEIMGKL